ncbi:hypothetical protein H0A70_05285 [Alcaligenaceae bacterium]|nr:hypothetical protein [Alcaligenaceae bacterium]
MEKNELIKQLLEGNEDAINDLIRRVAGGSASAPAPQHHLATLKSVRAASWDALGQYISVEFVAGPPDQDVRWPVLLTQEAAEQVLIALAACLREKPFSGRAEQ